ncbi:hypothetical protein HG536_0A05420 [Torulaspora globosa]|uniref:Uncharacterized protein n=1 Tax=Torulaspora globosa TaxID=48254 RepID=A0A7G3ZB41_9SACH|nr:uncharacterized protein HG536_0A05420 [Torulaspora globosa]QLL30727.1 hypothetical protein HG536_0A05420 [Torulaspora globosa]
MLQNYLLTQLLLLILFLISTAKGLPSSDVNRFSNEETTVNTVTGSNEASLSGTTENYSLQGHDQQSTPLAITGEPVSSKSSDTPVYLVSSPTMSYTDTTLPGSMAENPHSQEAASQSFKVSSKQGTATPDVTSSPPGDSITSSSGKPPNVPTTESSQTTSRASPSFESREPPSSQSDDGSSRTSSLIAISTEANFVSSGFISRADSTRSPEPTQSAAMAYSTSSTVTVQTSSVVGRASDLLSLGKSTPIPTTSLTESEADASSETGMFQSQVVIEELYDFTETESETSSSTAQAPAFSSLDDSLISTSTHDTPLVTSSIPSTSKSTTLPSLAGDTTSGQFSYIPESSSKQSSIIEPSTSTSDEPVSGSFSKMTIDLVASEITPWESSSGATSTVQTTEARQPTTTSVMEPTTSNPLQPTEEGNQYRTAGSPSSDFATAGSPTQQTEEFTLYSSVPGSGTSSDEKLSIFLITTDSASEPYRETTYFSVPPSSEPSFIATASSNELPVPSSASLTTENAIFATTDITSQSSEDHTTFLITKDLPDTASSATSDTSATINPQFVSLSDTSSVPSSIIIEQTVNTASYLSSPTLNSPTITNWPEATSVELTTEATSSEYLASTIEIHSSPVPNTDHPTGLSDYRTESTITYSENSQDFTLLSSIRQTEASFISNDGDTSSMTVGTTTVSPTP